VDVAWLWAVLGAAGIYRSRRSGRFGSADSRDGLVNERAHKHESMRPGENKASNRSLMPVRC
jgi:hypothetical protein